MFVIFRKIGKLSNLNLDNDDKILESLHREYKCHKKIIVVILPTENINEICLINRSLVEPYYVIK